MTEPTDDAPTEPAAPAPTPAGPGGHPLLLRGFAPLVVGIAFAVLVILLAPSVAPEVEILRPGAPVTTTTETTGATTTTESSGSTTGPSSTAPSSTGPAEETAP